MAADSGMPSIRAPSTRADRACRPSADRPERLRWAPPMRSTRPSATKNVIAPRARPATAASRPPRSKASSVSSNAAALISTPAPKAMISPIAALGEVEAQARGPRRPAAPRRLRTPRKRPPAPPECHTTRSARRDRTSARSARTATGMRLRLGLQAVALAQLTHHRRVQRPAGEGVDQLAEVVLEAGRRDDLEDPAQLVARVPERVPLVARLEDQVARAPPPRRRRPAARPSGPRARTSTRPRGCGGAAARPGGAAPSGARRARSRRRGSRGRRS